MIENAQNIGLYSENTYANKPRKTLRMVENDRMAGPVPKWELPKTSTDKIEYTLENAQSFEHGPDNALAYAGTEYTNFQEEFGFGDLVDMVNPLHHIPVVGHIYREVSGDEIKPIGQIIGGAVFGGPLGAGSGLINTVIEEETGKDIAGNALNIVQNALSEDPTQSPETRLTETIETFDTPQREELPGNLLSFVDLKSDNGVRIERVEQATYPNLDKLPKLGREPISEVKLTGLYALSQ